jgi:hypothetical protein
MFVLRPMALERSGDIGRTTPLDADPLASVGPQDHRPDAEPVRLDHQCLDRIGCGETRDLPRECPELRRLRQSESALPRVPTRSKNWRISYDRSG